MCGEGGEEQMWGGGDGGGCKHNKLEMSCVGINP